MEVIDLASRKELIPELARLHFEEWGYLRPGETIEGRTARLRQACGAGVPSVAVGLLSGALCGSAMLVPHDLDARPDLTPWLAGVYVKPQYRRRGLATELIAYVINKARSLQFPQLFLYTPGSPKLYERLGWSFVEQCSQQGTSVIVMSRQLA